MDKEMESCTREFSKLSRQCDCNSTRQTINLLLMGETGVGKSTFINAFAHCVSFNSMNDAVQSKENICLIPVHFKITDDHFDEHDISFGKDINECISVGASATQRIRSYKFRMGDIDVRLLDTPGFGDTRGVNKDEENLEHLITTLTELRVLHGFCILLKPHNSRLTTFFSYCIKQLLSQLEKSACDNIMFVFTNTKGSNYRPGDTLGTLRHLLEDIENKPPNVKIPLNKNNVFCVDNEAFRCLVALKLNISMSSDDMHEATRSWDKSATAYKALVNYALQLKPHNLENSVCVAETRRHILKLSDPLKDVSESIYHNINLIKKMQDELLKNTLNIEKLEKDTDSWIDVYKSVSTGKRNVVCYSGTDKCANNNKYGPRGLPCCLDCQVQFWHGIFGVYYWCFIFKNGNSCHYCTCPFEHHAFSYTKQVFVNKIMRNQVLEEYRALENNNNNKKKILKMLTDQEAELLKEKDIIEQCIAEFSHFLCHHAITPYNDAYKDYLELSLTSERMKGSTGDMNKILHLNKTLEKHDRNIDILKNQLSKAKQDGNSKDFPSPKNILARIKSLYDLKHTGKIIKEVYPGKVSGNFLAETEVVHNFTLDKQMKL